MSIVIAAGLLTLVTAITCALPGVFVVLGGNSMLVDAIGHAAFPGIVVGFAITGNLDSPWLITCAAIAGLIVVWGAEALHNTGLITRESSQGLLFPALFAVGVILVTANFSDVHLDTHLVLIGDVNLASYGHIIIGGYDIGSRYMYVLMVVCLINALFLAITYRMMVASTFDPDFAKVTGLRVRLLNATFMFLVACTVTAAFNAAGALLVLGLMVAPAATASQIARSVGSLIAWTLGIAAVGAVVGYFIAYQLDLATSATLAVFYALIFSVVVIAKNATQSRTSLRRKSLTHS